jgi:peptidoglycan hydrolase CwlO-like protein
MADDVTRKEFDALTKKVNTKFAEIDKWQKQKEQDQKDIVDTANDAIESINKRLDDLEAAVKSLGEADNALREYLTKAMNTINDNTAKLERRIDKLE